MRPVESHEIVDSARKADEVVRDLFVDALQIGKASMAELFDEMDDVPLFALLGGSVIDHNVERGGRAVFSTTHDQIQDVRQGTADAGDPDFGVSNIFGRDGLHSMLGPLPCQVPLALLFFPALLRGASFHVEALLVSCESFFVVLECPGWHRL